MIKKSIKIIIYPLIASAVIILSGVALGKSIISNQTFKIIYSMVLVNFALLSPLIFKESKESYLKGISDFKNLNIKIIPLTIFYYIAFNIFTSLLLFVINVSGILENYFKSQEGTIEILKQIQANGFLLFIMVGILGPLLEELYFRNFMQENLKKIFNLKIAIIGQAIIFGVLHGEIQSLGFVLLWGIYLGIIRSRNNIYYSFLLHSMVNTISLLVIL